MINFLFLDADDTLLDFSWAEDQAIHRTYRELGAEMTDEMYARYHVVNQGYWQTYERGEITREALLVARHRQMFEEYGLECDPVQCENLYRKTSAWATTSSPTPSKFMSLLNARLAAESL